ncbi:cleavage and polyadenylation specificity factor subunit 4-like [Aulostomus maculatus]
MAEANQTKPKVDHIKFYLEVAVEQQLGIRPLLFPGMDSEMCPFRHIMGEKKVVCKHWLRGLCRNADQCEFLHEYDATKMPECSFYSKFGECNNKRCPFLHTDPKSKMEQHPWNDQSLGTHSTYRSLWDTRLHGPDQQPQDKRANSGPQQNNMASSRRVRPLDQVTCFKDRCVDAKGKETLTTWSL